MPRSAYRPDRWSGSPPVFFGPTIARTRIEEGDLRAARALQLGATGLSIAVLALVATGFAGVAGQVARGVAASGLAVFAWSVTVVCVPVIRSALRSTAPERWSVLAVAAWFVPMAWSDAVFVGAGGFLEPIGVGMLLGVLAQSIVAAGGYIAPRLVHLDPVIALPRTEALAVVRAATWNVGTLLLVGAAIIASPFGSLGWALVITSAVMRSLVVLWAAARRG